MYDKNLEQFISGDLNKGMKTRRYKMKKIIALLLLATFVFGQTTLAFAGNPAQRFPFPDVSVNVINPCNNNPVTVTWNDLELLTRNGQDSNGDAHTVFKLQGSMFDTTGFSGQFLLNSHYNGTPDSFQVTEIVRVIARNPETHQTIILLDTFHINLRDSVPVLEINRFNESCVGKPN